jgi:aryl-alcohol dehydrogenase-like predicted oxidoreductase
MKKDKNMVSRRQFLKKSSLGLATASTLPIILSCTGSSESQTFENVINEKDVKSGYGASAGNPPSQNPNTKENLLGQRILGKTEMKVSLLAFGGGSQFMNNVDGEWEPILERAVEVGVNYFDTAWNYGGGESEIRFGKILNNYRKDIYIATKLDARESEESKQQFEGCLNRLKMDYVDVLMMHAISENDVLSTIEKGVWKEMVKFKEEGTTKFIGFSVMLEEDLPVAKAIIENFDVDVILGIINPVGRFGNCAALLPIVKEKNIGFMSMKALRNMVSDQVKAKELISYALDKEGVAGTVIGHYGIENLEENINIVKEYSNISSLRKDWGALEKRMEKFAETHTPVWTLPGYHDGMLV